VSGEWDVRQPTDHSTWKLASGQCDPLKGLGSDYGLRCGSTCGYYGTVVRGSCHHVARKTSVGLLELLLAQLVESNSASYCVYGDS